MTRSRIWKLAKLTKWQGCDSCVGFVMNKMDKTSHLLKQNWIVSYQEEVVCKERSSTCCPQKSCMLPTSPCVSLLPIVLNSVGNLWIKSGETQKINISGRNCRKKVPTYHFIFGGSVTWKKSNIKNEVIIIAVFPVQSWLQQKAKCHVPAWLENPLILTENEDLSLRPSSHQKERCGCSDKCTLPLLHIHAFKTKGTQWKRPLFAFSFPLEKSVILEYSAA